MTPAFSPAAIYRSSDDSATIKFDYSNRDNSFAWQGAQLDKVGTYQLQQAHDACQLELTYNYGREETYQITFLTIEQDTLISFRLTDRHGRETEFTRS